MSPHAYTLLLLSEPFAIARLAPTRDAPAWIAQSPIWSVTRTPDELSVLCAEAAVPDSVACERAWRCFAVQGPLALSEVGVLASIAKPLAASGVSIFAISTYDTDYVLVRNSDLSRATEALRSAGHTVDAAL